MTTLSVLKHIGELSFPFNSGISDRTRSNTIKEIIDAATQNIPLTDRVIFKVFSSYLIDKPHCSKYVELIETALLPMKLGTTKSLSNESLDALKKVNEAYTQAALFLAGSFLMA